MAWDFPMFPCPLIAIIVFIAFSVFFYRRAPGAGGVKKIMDCYIQKKRGSLYLLPVPHFEAFALPSLIERATQKPTPICNQPHCALLVYSACSVMIYTYPMDAYRCHVPEQTLKFAKFRSVKNKAPCKRLLYMCPNPPAALQRRRGAGSCKVNIFCNKNRFGLNPNRH